MKNEFFYLSSDGKTNIHAIEWVPEKPPVAIVQICHGMVEYVDRYHHLASFFADNGFYVVGNDHLGHGLSVQDEGKYGFFNEEDGNGCVISDIHKLRQIASEKYPGIPYFILGHSMGSFLARQYIEMYPQGLSGAIIMGTGTQSPAVLKTAKSLCRMSARSKGWSGRSDFINKLATGNFNKKWEPSQTHCEWLTKDPAVYEKYAKDPLCSFTFTLNAYYNMFLGIEYLQDKKNIAKIPKTLPLFLVSGADDPVGNFGKGVQQAYGSYKSAGIKDLKMKLYPGDRHEIHNELDKDQVFSDLLDWLNAHLPK